MGTVILTIVLAINVVLYLGLPSYESLGFEGELFGMNILQKSDSGEVLIDNSLNATPDLQASTTIANDQNTISLFDPLGVVRSFIGTLFGIVFAPIKLLLYAGVPSAFVAMFGVPLGLLNIVAIWSWIRGVFF